MTPCVPLTRANSADLPAPESLVRASAEPMQQQEAVLLRAARQDEQRHEEQLLRPAPSNAYRVAASVVTMIGEDFPDPMYIVNKVRIQKR